MTTKETIEANSMLNELFANMLIPQMLEEKEHSRKGGFNLRCNDGDYLRILYTWERDGVYEEVKLPERA